MENTQFDVLIKATMEKDPKSSLKDISIRILNSETIANAFKTSIVNTILKYVAINAFGLSGFETKDDSITMKFSDGSANVIYDNTLEFVKPTDNDINLMKISFKFDDEKTSVNLESFNLKDRDTEETDPFRPILKRLHKILETSSLDSHDKENVDKTTKMGILAIMKMLGRGFSNCGNTKPDDRFNTF